MRSEGPSELHNAKRRVFEKSRKVARRKLVKDGQSLAVHSRSVTVHSPCPLPRSLPVPVISSFCSTPILAANFFQIDALDLAPRLLGKLLRRDDVVLQITEFGPGGHAYVYLCYGLHVMLNIVADKEGVGAAVLIRSCAPISGLEVIQERRGLKTEKPVLLTGPGKVGQALGISTDWSNHPLYSPGGLEILEGPEPERILVGPRVGIDYATPEHLTALWRFAVAGSSWISAPKNTLQPS